MKIKKTEGVNDGPTTSSARIRENQRRSRQRRKEYIQHLEQRLSSFERLGVEATQEVQKAGRKVAVENGLLRSLLNLHGVTEPQIEQYLQSQRRSTSSPLSQNPPVVSQISATSRLRAIPSEALPDYKSSPAAPPPPDIKDPPPEVKPVGTRSPQKGDMIMHTDTSNVQESSEEQESATTESVSEPQQLDRVQDKGQYTSCEDAAKMVASIRNYPDSRDVRSDLGCASESNCMVKNMSIFDVLDK
ncbi:hypothetical protein N7517_010973 [Penicillium concentricum]|uniref:BZIP domain-containing protein n=1 Tax=Penicillium concentricum TaxID=293559 RepID=A0A9W9UTU4_9EURO|nr:uncharacterized protein N7517_010973 [Penicillium concentricum]KAJ5356364.1 hypothetical protein N7517_010973 [Penicillium concentricum]